MEFWENGTFIPELTEYDSGLNATGISDKTEHPSLQVGLEVYH